MSTERSSIWRKNLTSFLTSFFTGALLFLACTVPTQGQNDAVTRLAQSPGSPAGSYALSNIDNISLFNGRVSIRLPLVFEAGRGNTQAQVTMTWDTPAPWGVFTFTDTNNNLVHYPALSPYFSANNGRSGEFTIRMVGEGSGVGQNCDGYALWNRTLTRMYIVDPDGTEHEMRDALTGGQSLQFLGNCWSFTGPSRGKIFVSTDGFGATYIADADIHDGPIVDSGPQGGGDGGWILLKDGRRIRTSTSQLVDRNGNKDSYIVGQSRVDSLNRPIWGGADTGSQCQTIAPGANFCQWLSHKGFGGAERRIWIALDSDSRPYQVILPNGLRYHFYYNEYEDLTRIDLPTGGSLEYDYGPGFDGPQPTGMQGAPPGVYPGGPNDSFIYRRVTERRVYREGHVLEDRQTFSKPEYLDSNYAFHNLGYVEKKEYDSNSNLLHSEKHYFFGAASNSFKLLPLEYSSWKEGREYRSEFYDATGNLLRANENTWEQRTAVSWWTGNPDNAPQNDPRISQTLSYLENGQFIRTVYAYDSTVPYNSLTDVYSYDYNAALLRHSQTTYLKTLNGVDYSGSNIQNASSPHLRDFPIQVSVFDGGNVERARTTYEYDNYSNDGNHAPLVNRSGISGFDAGFDTSYTRRGNVTATTSYLLVNGSVTGSVTAYAQYDIAGNVVKTIDPRGYPTTFDYTDHFGSPDAEARSQTAPSELSSVSQSSYAFASSVTNALGQTAYAQFDYYLGTPVDVEDLNGVVSSGYFNDDLDRPTQVIRGSNQGTGIKSQSAFSYDDTNHVITATSDQTSYGDNLLKSKTIYDGLGRTVETRQYEAGTNYIAVKQVPFVVLQDPDSGVWVVSSQSSNPYRPYLGEQPIWTTAFSDPLGRAAKVRTPDGAMVKTSYADNSVTVTDQAGKQRKSVSDGLGRLTQVYEAPNDQNYNFLTTYGYDALDNLVSVSQIDPVTQYNQTRTFFYDSLKRLSYAINPESATVNYDYDNNGNILHRTDARSITTTLSYDALNRPTAKSYSDGTPTVNYFYDSQSLPSGAPSSSAPDYYSRGSSAGRLVAVTYGASSNAGDYLSFDAAGRAALKIQRTGGINYKTSAVYNLAGAVTSETYPSGHTVSYDYDSAGRTNSFTGYLGDGNQRNYSTGIVYSPFGMAKEQFGTTTAIYNKYLYNNRGQLAEIRAGTTYTGPSDTSWNRGAIVNHYSNQGGCWGASCSATDNNGNLMKQEYFIPTVDIPQPGDGQWTLVAQQFDYDNLNRLQEVHEGSNWRQRYVYDRFGNRTIDQTNTTSGIPKPNFGVDQSTNRLTAPSGSSMTYDAAGNLTYDSSSGSQGDRTYDAENRMTAARGGFNASWQYYVYDGTGQRIRRNINTAETWQVYGLGGELVAEYAANAAAASPQKEYGYRNGQLLITATVMTSWGAPPELEDNPLNPPNAEKTTVKAIHITQLRSAINGLRSHLGMSNYPWTTSATTSDWISAGPILEMRIALDQALGSPSPSYATGLAQGQSILAVHIQELRNRVLAAWVSSNSTEVRWLVADQLGTPRMIFDQSGGFSSVSRHDYLPFGEELFVGGRTSNNGYTNNDNTRQRFTGYERDSEVNLDFAQARSYSNTQGRFTRPDPLMASADLFEPQSWNRYSYVINNPLNYVDPLGLAYNMGGGTAEMNSQDPTKPSATDLIVFDPKDTVVVNVNADKDTGKRLTENEAAAKQFRNLMGTSLADDFGSRASGAATAQVDGRTSAFVLFSEFIYGVGPRNRRMGPDAYMTKQLRTSPDVATARNTFAACAPEGACKRGPDGLRKMGPVSNGYFGLGAADSPWQAGTNMPRQFVGGSNITIEERNNGTALFTIDNDTGVYSGSYHKVPNAPWSKGPLSTTHQTYWWTEKAP